METENTPPDGREYTLQEAAELVGRDYAYLCSVVKDLDLGHLEERRPGSKGPQRRLLRGEEVEALKRHFAGKEASKNPAKGKPTMRRLTHLKLKTTKAGITKLEIAYQQPPDGQVDEWDDYSICSTAPARPELYEALAALPALVCEDLELPADYAKDMRVSGVTCSWTNDIMGATICVLKPLKAADSPLVLNTPHKPSEPYSEGAGGHLLPEAIVDVLALVESEALRYVDGERAQLRLEFGEEGKTKPLSIRVAEAILDSAENPESTAARDLLSALEGEGNELAISAGGRSVTLSGRQEVTH